MLRKPAAVQPAETSVQDVVLAEAPAVAAHVGTEIKFRDFRTHGARSLLLRVHGELSLLRGDDLLGAHFRAHILRNGTEVTPSSDHQFCVNLAVHDPASAVPFQFLKRHALNDACAGALQQVIVEFKTADSIAHDTTIISFDFRVAHSAGAKSLDLLE